MLYRVPEKFPTRKPAPMLKYLVETTDDIASIQHSYTNSLDPSFIFIHPSLNESEIQQCTLLNLINSLVVKRVNGQNILLEERSEKLYKLKNLSQELYENYPTIYLLVSNEYSTSDIDGFLSVLFYM